MMAHPKSRETIAGQGIVVARTNFAEADRIVTFITRKHGKVRVIAKGVRKERSKLAGGIELFSVSDICFVPGRGELATLTSARLVNYYDKFIIDIAKVDFAYNCIKQVNKFTTDDVGEEYFIILNQLFIALNEPRLPLASAQVWWYVQFSNINGHALNLETTTTTQQFENEQKYVFDTEHAGFSASDGGMFEANHIKLLRLALLHGPLILANVQNGAQMAEDLAPYLKTFVEYQL